jgi:hypothetical protein
MSGVRVIRLARDFMKTHEQEYNDIVEWSGYTEPIEANAKHLFLALDRHNNEVYIRHNGDALEVYKHYETIELKKS